ncbi:Y-family DNA polymerase [Pseudosulfitobacter pseudonitzschiae]|uniref:Y-family DNA polymerase n=1 Tax=Pseudosulfitobacter pseudonitzschiae TaxID=1402135 RepID=UPI003B761254
MNYRVLYIDMNSFFASVEQQLDPGLRGRPLGITAMENDKGSCVAASYEAKAYGVKTGTSVREARQLCPDIQFRPSRHRLYVRFNLKVAEILDRFAELDKIRSVDEFQLILSGDAAELEGARDLVTRMKRAVAAELGECLRFSAGIGPNHLLAKIAGKLQKPDGFRWLNDENMPGALAHLDLDDLPGISKGMGGRLAAAGVNDIASLVALDPRHARRIWNSVEGERFVRMLQGMDIPLASTKRGGFGNSKVLAPEFRKPEEAYLVSRWLVEKATARLRQEGSTAGRFSVQISVMDQQGWSRTVKTSARQDTLGFLRIHRALWREAWPYIKGKTLMSIGVQLNDIGLLQDRSGDLLSGLKVAERSSSERASAAVDFLNARFGDGTIRFGDNRPHPGFFERG